MFFSPPFPPGRRLLPSPSKASRPLIQRTPLKHPTIPSVPFIGGSAYLHDPDGQFIGLASVGLAVNTLEDVLGQKIRSLPHYQTGGRLYIMTGDTHDLVLASQTGVSWVELTPYTPGAPINVLNCTDDVIRKSAYELRARQWSTGELFTSENGQYHISTRTLSSASYRLAFETDWVFVVVQEVNCPVNYKTLSDGSCTEVR